MKRIEQKTMYLSNGALRERVIRILLQEAKKARLEAYAPYSRFHVGAALLTMDGHIYTGVNVENASYGATICAERAAVAKAVSEGKRNLLAIAIAGGPVDYPFPEAHELIEAGKDYREKLVYCPPCGICRQVLQEFCDPANFYVITEGAEEEYSIHTLEQLLPSGFSRAELFK